MMTTSSEARLAVVLVLLAISHNVWTSGVLSNGKPPVELQAAGMAYATREFENNQTTGRRVNAGISADTLGKKVLFKWEGTSSSQVVPFAKNVKESVSFWPTALCFSMTDHHILFVAGRSTVDTPVLERWTIEDDYTITEVTTIDGTRALFAAPTIEREAIPIDQGIGQISSIAASPWALASAPEEVWVLDWTAKVVWGVNPTDGSKVQRANTTEVGKYRTLDMKEHSILGGVCLLVRCPWFAETGSWLRSAARFPTFDPDLRVMYDNDNDGVIDSTEVVSRAVMMQHALWSTGTWTRE